MTPSDMEKLGEWIKTTKNDTFLVKKNKEKSQKSTFYGLQEVIGQ